MRIPAQTAFWLTVQTISPWFCSSCDDGCALAETPKRSLLGETQKSAVRRSRKLETLK